MLGFLNNDAGSSPVVRHKKKRPQRDLNASQGDDDSQRFAPPRAEKRAVERSSDAPPAAEPTIAQGLTSPRCNNVTSRLREALDALRSLDGRRTESILLDVLRSLGDEP